MANRLCFAIGLAGTTLLLLTVQKALTSAPLMATDQIDAMRSAMKQAHDGIISGKGAVRVAESHQGTMSYEVEYTVSFDHDRGRIVAKRLAGDVLTFDAVWDGSSTLTWFHDSRMKPAVRISTKHGGVARGAFEACISPYACGFRYPNTRSEVTCVGTEAIAGDDCTILEWLPYAKAPEHGAYNKTRAWVNSHKGYSTPKVETWFIDSETGREFVARRTTVSVKRNGDGRFVPTACTEVNLMPDGSTKDVRTVTFDPKFQWNVAIARSEFASTLPVGTKLWNEDTKVLSIVGKDGTSPDLSRTVPRTR